MRILYGISLLAVAIGVTQGVSILNAVDVVVITTLSLVGSVLIVSEIKEAVCLRKN